MWSLCGHTREKKKRAAKPMVERDACKRDMTEAGLKEDNTSNRAAWRNQTFHGGWL